MLGPVITSHPVIVLTLSFPPLMVKEAAVAKCLNKKHQTEQPHKKIDKHGQSVWWQKSEPSRFSIVCFVLFCFVFLALVPFVFLSRHTVAFFLPLSPTLVSFCHTSYLLKHRRTASTQEHQQKQAKPQCSLQYNVKQIPCLISVTDMFV